MQKKQVVPTPFGPAMVITFPMMKGFFIGVRLRALDGSWDRNYPKTTVERWIRENEHVEG